MTLIRLQKHLSDKGLASRRLTKEWILKGYIFLNGQKVTDTGIKIDPAEDQITFSEEVKNRKKYYYLFNKPKGIVTINAQKGEREILDLLDLPEGVVPVGRLDKDSCGLILLTNDGVVARRLMEPKYNHEKEYLVNFTKPVTFELINSLSRGMYLFGQKTKPIKVKKLNNYKLTLTLTEGKNRQIRRLCSQLGFSVKDLIRIRILGFHLGQLPPAKLRKLTPAEVNLLYDKLNLCPS